MRSNENLAAFLRKTALERQLSLRDFGTILGMSHAYVGKLMRGVDSRTSKPVSPTIDTLLKIADALEIPRIEFLRQCGYLDK